jgi:hypothetical protein
MRTKSLLNEALLIEREIELLTIQSGLSEMLKEEFVVRAVLAEERKVIRYAMHQGIIDKRDVNLNEGIIADIVLGVGQMLGNWATIVGVPLGSIFGAAGVLWYGNEMLKGTPGSFQFYMDLIFCLFSAAAVPDPSPATGTAATVARTIIAPFAKLGEAARALGRGVLEAGAALKWTQSLGPAGKAGVNAIVKVEPQVVKSFPFIDRVVTRAGDVMRSVASKVSGLPGGKSFARIAGVVVEHAAKAWQLIKECLQALINVGKTSAAAEGKALTTTAGETTALATAGAARGFRVVTSAQVPSVLTRMQTFVGPLITKIEAQMATNTIKSLTAAGAEFSFKVGDDAGKLVFNKSGVVEVIMGGNRGVQHVDKVIAGLAQNPKLVKILTDGGIKAPSTGRTIASIVRSIGKLGGGASEEPEATYA